MTTTGTRARGDQVASTRAAILSTAERLFAEHGVAAVSARQISEAAGQGNNAAVGYHFGTKLDVVRAILAGHNEAIEARRARRVAEVSGSTELRDWVTCLVLPSAEYFASLGTPTWYARFSTQIMTDPVLRPVMQEDSLGAPSLRQVLHGIHLCEADLPTAVRHDRGDMAMYLLLHTFADLERAQADGDATGPASWARAASGLVDAMVGLFQAPATLAITDTNSSSKEGTS
ncbi:TetR/AcrR family transcriptional regulator [Promicromonospora sp. NFX87]|uniref:TetR/AcrR family transcriptional regulator n=1 Tax=Promicromonospora sp. NFX87 TaxID=3402691 RepID=UPI003AFB4C72